MPHHAAAPVRQLQLRQRAEKGLNLDLNGFGKQLAGTRPQNIRQWVVNRAGLTKGKQVGSLDHGVSLSL